MLNRLKLLAATVLTASALAISGPAVAVPLTTDLVVGSLTYHLTSCSTGASTGNTATPCANVDWIANGPLGVTIEQSLGSVPLEIAAVKSDSSNGYNSYSDLSIQFTITSSVPNYLLGTSLSLDAAGDQSSFGETLSTGGAALQALATSTTRSTITASRTFSSPQTSITASADIKASSSAPNGTIYSVSQTVTVVPEPASLALLGAGVVAFAGFRRRRTAL